MGGTSEIADPPNDTRFFSCCCCFQSMRLVLVLVPASDEGGGGCPIPTGTGTASTGSVCPAWNRTPESAWKVACLCSRSNSAFSDCLAMLDGPGPVLLDPARELCEKELSEGVAGR